MSDVIYRYDGSFDGLMCCVFESYSAKEQPVEVFSDADSRISLLPEKVIKTEPQKAARVTAAISQKMGAQALVFTQHAFLTCHPEKDRLIICFVRLGFEHGSVVISMLSDDVVNTLAKAVGHLQKEAHLLRGFIRFSEFDGALAAKIDPKNCVLPLIANHFCDRYREENFIIYDETNNLALTYASHRAEIIPVENFQLPAASEQ